MENDLLHFSPYSYQSDESFKFLAGNWCQIPQLSHIETTYLSKNQISKEELIKEEAWAQLLYLNVIKALAKDLNNIHQINYSLLYWEILLSPFLHQAIATFIDHLRISKEVLLSGKKALILDTKEWGQGHRMLGGSSRLYHFCLYSEIVSSLTSHFEVVSNELIHQNLQKFGDGKKSLSSAQNNKKTTLLPRLKKCVRPLIDFYRGRVHLKHLHLFNQDVVLLGDQYLKNESLKKIFPHKQKYKLYTYLENINTENFAPCSLELRNSLKNLESSLQTPDEVILYQIIKKFLPSCYLENYFNAKEQIIPYMPKRKLFLLDSKNCSGGEAIDFLVAESVEKFNSQYLMACHGGCYGAMEVSFQEYLWSRISTYYALWSEAKQYSEKENCLTLPSLRFYKHVKSTTYANNSNQITLYLTGYYPNRYSYNSIYPYTMDPQYHHLLLNFLNELNPKHLSRIVVRDYHNSNKINKNVFSDFCLKNEILFQNNNTFIDSVKKSRICIHTLPQTTYLETLVLDHPTLCFWNTDANLIREDLTPYYQEMFDAEIFHESPLSAAKKLAQVYDNPQEWWYSQKIRNARESFLKHVCQVSEQTPQIWREFIESKLS